MEQAAPPIYFRPPEPQRMGWAGRLTALALALGCLILLLVAGSIRPSPNGFGTHVSLGLQPCQFERQTGVPCPTCGMTTSFAYFVRGDLAASFYVQPMGMVLAFMAGMVFWAGTYEALTGTALHRLLRIVPSGYYLWVFCGLTLIAWAWKIWIHVTLHDGWHA